jgi:hypothetical protein
MTFPTAIPEIPVASIDKASTYYVEKLGFTSIGETSKVALQAFQGIIAGCFSPIALSVRATATKAQSFSGSI